MNKSAYKKGKNIKCKSISSNKSSRTVKTCRACLEKGKMAMIPINSMESCNLLHSIKIYGDIEIEEDDPFPKYLCEACHTLLQNAMLFRQTVQHSDKLLRQLVKQEDVYCNIPDGSVSPCSPQNDAKDFIAFNESTFEENQMQNPNVSKDDNKKSNPVQIPQNIRLKAKKIIPKIICDICKKSISKYYYKDHLALHGFGTPKKKAKAECKICNKSMEKSYFKQHMSTVHSKDPSKYICFICGKVFCFQSGYKSHILSHSNEFPYKCQHCPYRGRHSGLLKTHMRVHERDYKFQCTDCNARFLTSGNLRKHMLKHKEKKFKCEACARAFHTKTDQEQHFQVDHLGIKSHICNVCDKAFGYRKAMMKHMSKIHRRAKQQCGRLPSYLMVESHGDDKQ